MQRCRGLFGLFVPSASAKGAGIYLLFVSLTPLKGAEIIKVRGEVLPKFYSAYNNTYYLTYLSTLLLFLQIYQWMIQILDLLALYLPRWGIGIIHDRCTELLGFIMSIKCIPTLLSSSPLDTLLASPRAKNHLITHQPPKSPRDAKQQQCIAPSILL